MSFKKSIAKFIEILVMGDIVGSKVKLLDRLIKLCEMEGIPISYHENLGDAAGRLSYNEAIDSKGNLVILRPQIEILEKCRNSPDVLAHEVMICSINHLTFCQNLLQYNRKELTNDYPH